MPVTRAAPKPAHSGHGAVRIVALVARLRVTVAYAVIVACVTAAMLRMDPDMHDALIRHASTNLHNLSHGRVGTLIGSAFVVDAGPIYLWLPGLVCLLAVAELLWGSAPIVVAFALGHIGATLVVAAGLVAAVRLDWMSASVAARIGRRDELRRDGGARRAHRGDPGALASRHG